MPQVQSSDWNRLSEKSVLVESLSILIYVNKKWCLPLGLPDAPARAQLQSATCRLLNDDTLRAYESRTLHLHQLVFLSTVFEFDGYSNNIPPLSCHSRPKKLQIKYVAAGGGFGRQTPHRLRVSMVNSGVFRRTEELESVEFLSHCRKWIWMCIKQPHPSLPATEVWWTVYIGFSSWRDEAFL